MDSRLKLLLPASEIEAGAWDQINENLGHDFLKAMAIMPDVHQGYDLPIGAVALLDDYVSPSYVGYDIGCGMSHVVLQWKYDFHLGMEWWREIYERISMTIPTGFSTQPKRLDYPVFASASGDEALTDKVNSKAGIQLGTLGGGNHFIELGVNSNNEVCITLHSGSRNSGHSIATYYMKQGRFFPLDSDMGQMYLADLHWAQEYALDNRRKMMEDIVRVLGVEAYWDTFINENHNHALVTKDGVLHRKGATPADKGQLGLIPTNMANGVYITEGLGNEEYLCSASHGAGRLMSRTRAKKNLSLEVFTQQMDGIVAGRLSKLIDEAPDSYKNPAEVIGRQEGIVVKVLDHVEPILNVKA